MMAGYRPKSLDELNDIFGKTIAAEKAIKKGSSLLESGEDVFSSFSGDASGGSSDEGDTKAAPSEKESDEITDSVSDFIARYTAQAESGQTREKPQMTIISAEAPKKEFEIEPEPPVTESQEILTEAETTSREDLLRDYARIMSDEDDDTPTERKLSRKEKKKLRRREKVQGTEESAAQGGKKTESGNESEVSGEADGINSEAVNPEDSASHTSFAPENGDETEVSSGVDNDFDFPENYTPEWIKEEQEPEEDEEAYEGRSSNIGMMLLKIFLALILVILIGISSVATVLKSFVAVNTGKLVADRYYVFTTYKDYPEAEMKKGSLVITTKEFAEDGDIFVYADYVNKTFELGKRNDSITKDDGEVLYIIEKDGGRTLVSRDDCKGVVYSAYENYGSIVSLLTDNYIVIVAASAVVALVIVLLFAFALRTKKEEEYEDDDESESYEESEEEEFEDIFSTVE